MSDLREILNQAWPPAQWLPHRTLIGVSGGADSVALTNALVDIARTADRQPGALLTLAHFNHRLRGDDADQDADFVAQLAEQLGLPMTLGQAPQPGNLDLVSEESLRRERYAFFTAESLRWGARCVAVAHTRDDQCETILFRLLRGTSIAGLRGMAFSRPLNTDVTLVRPLLRASRVQVIAYLQAIGQPWREDASNTNRRFARNRIRHQLIPLLQKINPEFVEHLATLGQHAAEYHAVVVASASELAHRCVTSPRPHCVRIDARPLRNQPELIVRELLAETWKQMGWPQGDMTDQTYRRLAALIMDQPDAPEFDPSANHFPGGIRLVAVAVQTYELVREIAL